MRRLLMIFVLGAGSIWVQAQSNLLLSKAKDFIADENFIKAQKILDELISKDSSIAEAFSLRARCLMKRGRYDQAEQNLKFSLELDSLNPDAYCGLGSVYSIRMKSELAIANYARALEIDSMHIDSYNSRGALKFYFLNDYEGAMVDYNRALKIEPNDDYALYNRGILFNYLEEYDRAYNDLSKSIEYKDKQSDAYYARGRTCLFLGKYRLAIKDFKKTVKFNKPIGPFGLIDNGEVYYNIGYCYQELNKSCKANAFFRKAAKLGYE